MWSLSAVHTESQQFPSSLWEPVIPTVITPPPPQCMDTQRGLICNQSGLWLDPMCSNECLSLSWWPDLLLCISSRPIHHRLAVCSPPTAPPSLQLTADLLLIPTYKHVPLPDTQSCAVTAAVCVLF